MEVHKGENDEQGVQDKGRGNARALEREVGDIKMVAWPGAGKRYEFPRCVLLGSAVLRRRGDVRIGLGHEPSPLHK
ncbi:hypothetical protein DQK91_21230 [Oceanidesulfovibrio marinus]|uniref:Uncharacterized protein n=1 Tax=Oceanidesulfovibrio marinus TaxID=370038 RepID=A0A6P1ZBA9_9BACT|nr:hypothetical protein DQK91_21230 [Oceanidesulfovibrio marinus]